MRDLRARDAPSSELGAGLGEPIAAAGGGFRDPAQFSTVCTMEAHQLFVQLALILLAARVLAEVAERFNAPGVIGELCAGVLLGPSLLGVLAPNETLHLLAEIGIILLLFEVGLETDVGRLLRTGGRSVVVALGGFVFPFVLGYGLSRWAFGMDQLVALMIGGTLTATSIGVTVRILTDIGRQNTAEYQIVLGAAVLDDILGVVLLALLYDFAVSGQVSVMNAIEVLTFVGVFFVAAPVAAKTVSLVIRWLDRLSYSAGVIPTTIVSLVLIAAWGAHEVGAPELLGGFAAGLALSRRFFIPFALSFTRDTRFAERIDEDMKPIIRLFTPIFFVMVGISLDLTAVDWGSPWLWMVSLSLLGVSILGKFGGALMIPEPIAARIAIGMSMVPRGEVGLIFAELGRTSGILDKESYAILVLVIAYTTLLSPFWIKSFYRLFSHRIDGAGKSPRPALAGDDAVP